MAVFANSMEISSKAMGGKSICEFPDVCFTPPQTPATPPGVPIPYPNTGMASDTSGGSSSVKIGGQEVMLKDKSAFKQSVGDEAGAAPKKGIISSKNKGKVYFIAWSMDVKVEGENVVRNLDMTTHNHGSGATGAVPAAHIAGVSPAANIGACKTQVDNVEAACKGQTTKKCSPECRAKQKCILVPKGKAAEYCCSPDTTGDHVFEDHWIWDDDGELMPDFEHLGEKKPKSNKYVKPGGPYDGAPTLCSNKSRYAKIHGAGHGARGVREDELIGKPMKYTKARQISLDGLKAQCVYTEKTDPGVDPECSEECFKKQIDAFYGADGSKECRSPTRKQPLKEKQREKALDDMKPSTKKKRGKK
jgi:hypothetical protein